MRHSYVADTLTVKYAGAFEYNQANAFKRLALSEGQAVFRKDTIRFDYYLKDHIGNVRVVSSAESQFVKAGRELVAETSRAARRQAMRDAGILTSQQPYLQSKNASGSEYRYDIFKK
ncbi:hypothetical protein [Dyadobacter sp. CY323]|uniref:hypothetical protein n=1 Tax=Dyadobacter sp. CY323 TaxID=2907302 RepID=UPI001F43321A|nr:hypothetical protein [Dyadobacter sp. CY323]MCE6987853.1 hypothetical protein [Dyadobacter sp. CY323]